MQGRKSPLSPDTSTKLDASLQCHYTTWRKEISFIFSHQPNVMIWERGKKLGSDLPNSWAGITLFLLSSSL